MRRHCERVGFVLAMAAVGLVGLAGLAVGAEPAPPSAPSGFAGWLLNPVPETLPFRLTGEADLSGQKLEGNRNSPNFRTYSVIEEGFVANRFRLGIETKDQRWYMNFRGLDIGKNDQNYQVSLGRYGRYRFDLEWDEIPHLYAQGARSPFLRSEGGIYNLPAGIAAAAPNKAIFNGSSVFDLKTRNDSGRGGFWWAPTPEWDLQLKYDHTRRAGNRPIGAGFGGATSPLELPEPIEWQIDQLNATVGYSTPLWQLQGGYSLSIFGNDIKTMTYDNPLFTGAACSATAIVIGCASQGRMILAPDNRAHNLFLTGGLNLPMATRLAAKVSYGMNLQNDTFFTPTINSALLAIRPGLSPAYFAPSLRGDLRTMLINATGTSRPLQDVTVTGTYRYYGTDNRTLAQSFPNYAVRDAGPGTVFGTTTLIGRISVPEDYQKQNADLDAAYRILPSLTLRAGFGWERWDRPESREVGRSDEYSGKFGVGYRPLSWLDIAGRYTRSWKRIDNYNSSAPAAASFFPANFSTAASSGAIVKQRKFDEAARDRHKAELTFRLFPMENLEASVTLAYGQDVFPFSYLGMINDKNWSGAVDIGYTPVSWLTLRANYTREEYHSKQRETASVTNPTRDWINRNVDTYDTVGAGTIFRLVPDRLDLTADYSFMLSVGKLNTFNPVTPVPPPAVTASSFAGDFPDDRFTRHRIATALRYWVLKNFALRLGYTYERFRESYWQSDFIQPMIASSSTDIYLGVRPYKNYEAHIIGGGISYGF